MLANGVITADNISSMHVCLDAQSSSDITQCLCSHSVSTSES